MQKKVFSGIGGQAVLEGIMMRNKDKYSIACRKEDGSIQVEEYPITLKNRETINKIPIIRGIFAFVDSMIIGYSTLMESAKIVGDNVNQEEEKSKFEKWVEEKFGDKAWDLIMVIMTIISFIFAICIFMLFPAFISSLIKPLFQNNKYIIAIIEGLIRIFIFVIYIKFISRIPEIKRTFEYHGAEHKCINCIEYGLDLNVENVLKSSKEHKRCGTSFIVIVMVISIFFFMFIPTYNLKSKLFSRILFIPIIAGISYEVLRLAGKYENKLIEIISRPGMWMQGLTTKEPDEKEVEVAIAAVEKVFDWKKFKEENFKEDDIQ